MAVWTVRAHYDSEAHVWYSIEGDMQGLLVNAPTLEELGRKAADMLSDLLEINADDYVDKSVLEGPHRIRVIAFHEYDVAA